MKFGLTCGIVALLASSAMALIVEPETAFQMGLNDTRATATAIVRGSTPWADVGVLNLGASDDVDWFAIQLNAGEIFTAITTPLRTLYSSPDTVMALFDLAGTTAFIHNDDGGSGGAPNPVTNFGSALRFEAPTTDTYYLAITGWHGSAGQDADTYYSAPIHPEAGLYALTTSIVVPEPGTIAAIATGLVGLLGLRRRK